MERKRTQHDVAKNLVVGHLDVADGDTQAENLLELELDRRADLDQLVVQVFGVSDGGGELSGYTRILSLAWWLCIKKRWAHPWRDRDRGDGGSA